MTARCAVAGAFVAVLALLLTAACGESGSDTASSTSGPPATPDGVASAFAAAFAGGDTPLACTYTGGLAQQNLSKGGSDSLCSRSAWSAQSYWLADQCMSPAVDYPNGHHQAASYSFIYATNGPVAGADSFLVSVTGADRAWQVTAYTPGSSGQLGQICAVLDSALPTNTAASS